MNRPRLAAVLIAAAVVASACAGSNTDRPTSGASTAASPVVALTSVEQFAAAFNADTGIARVILPVAPT